MKKQLSKLSAITILLLLMRVTASVAQPQPVAMPPAAIKFSSSIPAEWSSKIVQQNAPDGENAIYFNFKKSDGTIVFLFQVNKVSEYQWIQLKDQLSDATILAHKNGFIYYAQSTEKQSIKGASAQDYALVYGQLKGMINSIVITE